MKAEIDKLDLNKFVNVPTTLSNLKTKVDNLDVDKLNTADLVNKEVVKKLNTNVNKLNKKTLDATTFIHINQYNADKQKLERKNWGC